MYANARQPLVPPHENASIPQNENDKKTIQPLPSIPKPPALGSRLAGPAKTVAFGRTTPADKKTDNATKKELNATNKTVSELEARVKALEDTIKSRDAHMENLTRMLENLVNNQSAASSPAPSQSAQPKLVVDQSAQSKSTPRQSIEAGTSNLIQIQNLLASVGVSLVEPRKQRGTVAVRNSGQSEKENVAPPANRSKRLPALVNSLDGVSIVDQSVARLDARDLRSLDNERERERRVNHVYELTDRLASGWLEPPFPSMSELSRDRERRDLEAQMRRQEEEEKQKWIWNEKEKERLHFERERLECEKIVFQQLRMAQQQAPLPRACPPPPAVRERGRRMYAWEPQEFTSVQRSAEFSVATGEHRERHEMRGARQNINQMRGMEHVGQRRQGIGGGCYCYGECKCFR